LAKKVFVTHTHTHTHTHTISTVVDSGAHVHVPMKKSRLVTP